MDQFGGFLSNDSTFGRIMTKIGTIIALNVLFAISCIPFFTIGAAASALYYAVFEMQTEEDPINPWKTYWQGFRKNFVPATLSWLTFAGVMALCLVNLRVCAQGPDWLRYCSAGVIAVLVVAIVLIVYLLPILAACSGKLRNLVKLSICASMSHPLQTILILLLHAGPIALFLMDEINRPTYAFIGAFFGFGVIAYIIGKLLLPLIDPYLDIENEVLS